MDARDFTPALAQWLGDLTRDLDARRRDHNWRTLPLVASRSEPVMTINGKSCVQFCSNNYLGLAADPRVIDAARRGLDVWGVGAGASRLVAGNSAPHEKLEADLARLKNQPAALIFSSGFTANLACLKTFASRADAIFSDKLNHASLLDAAAASGARHRTFPHLHYGRLEMLLAEKSPVTDEKAPAEKARAFIVSDTVFSMDGDICSTPAICALARRYGALVMLDEAHATGVLGVDGAGVAAMQNTDAQVAITVGTLSKALGSIGGFVAGPRPVIDSLINRGRSLIYTTALPAVCVLAAQAALDISRAEPWRRQRVCQLATHLHSALTQLGFDCGPSATPIIPVMLGTSQAAMSAAAALADIGIWVPAIRPPTVRPNSARLRISLMATHTDEQISRLIEAMGNIRTRLAATSGI